MLILPWLYSLGPLPLFHCQVQPHFKRLSRFVLRAVPAQHNMEVAWKNLRRTSTKSWKNVKRIHQERTWKLNIGPLTRGNFLCKLPNISFKVQDLQAAGVYILSSHQRCSIVRKLMYECKTGRGIVVVLLTYVILKCNLHGYQF